MEQTLYERPREKLRAKGPGALSMAELFQVVIGSGISRVPGARLAREIVDLLQRDEVTYDRLAAIPGIGQAKACQIIAVIEIARRV